MKHSSFVVILTFVILMVVGVAVSPLIDVGTEPAPRQGKSITIRYEWPNVSAKAIEQNLTSSVEGMVAALNGVESVSSNSYFGSCEIYVKLKEKAKVSAVRFEITSLLRQSYDRLPKGISYPTITGGEVMSHETSHHDQKLLLTYQVNAGMDAKRMKEYVQQHLKRQLESLEGVGKVEVTGTTDTYIDVNYNPTQLSACGITAQDLREGIQNYIGKDEILGIVNQRVAGSREERITLHLTMASFDKPLEQMPLKNVDGKTVYLNDLATLQVKNKEPHTYYRVNGLNTIYVNIYIPSDGKIVSMSDNVQETMKKLTAGLQQKLYFHLSYDSAKVQREEMSKLIWRTLMSLVLLLLFVWLTNRDLKYLLIIAFTLLANILVAIIMFWLFDIKLHVFSLAGITVSMGLIIDSTIVMADHYGYYHNRKVFLSIWAAMLTTIGSMLIIFFLPKELQQDLYDFAWIVIINLAVSLLVAFFFVPAIIDRWHYSSHHRKLRHGRAVVRWSHFYEKYILFTSRHKWVYYVLLIWAFGIPFHAFQMDFPEYLSTYLGGTIHLFSEYLHDDSRNQMNEQEKVLYIRAQMPVGGTAVQLNQKMMILEDMLKTYSGIKEFVTEINGGRGEIEIKFRKDLAQPHFPYQLENAVIGKVITIGGADWSTYGVSERGFSNALNLQYRANRILISGFNYDQLYRLAEDISSYMSKNKRVMDLTIETPEHENQEDEFYMDYDRQRMVLYHLAPQAVHQDLDEMWMSEYVGYYKNSEMASDVYMTPVTASSFDFWHLKNEQLRVDSSEVLVPELMQVKRREAKNVIPKKNQEYILNVAFNVLGSYTYTKDYIDSVIGHFNKNLPVGYHCQNYYNFGHPENDGNNYWILLLIVVVVFFICSILFESLRLAWMVVSLIPVSLIGAMLTFCITQVDFGSGGFASLVLLIGIVVNSAIYILSQYRHVALLPYHSRNNLQRHVKCYVCAYNHKVIHIFLTVASTIIGLLPFFLDAEEEAFWFSFATGVTGGLLFSLLALVFVMPIFVNFKRNPTFC